MESPRLSQVAIPLSARIIDAALAIRRNRHRCVIAVSDDVAVGVLSEGDIMRALLNGVDVHAPIEGWISRSFKFLRTKDKAAAFALMRKHGITLVPVLDEGFHLVDAITLIDMLQDCVLKDKVRD